MSSTTTITQRVPSATTRSTPTLTGEFHYYNSTVRPPLCEIADIFGGTSSRLRTVRCPVHDIRTQGFETFTLETHGFRILKHASSLLPPQYTNIPDFQDDALVRSKYWPEVVAILKTNLNIRAAAINTTVRDVPADGKPLEINPSNPRAKKQSLGGFFGVHGDYSPAGGRAHLQAMLPSFFADNGCLESTNEAERDEFMHLRDEIQRAEQAGMAEEGVSDAWAWSGRNYRGPRWGILSVWRPLETVQRDPLAMMDVRGFFGGGQTPYVGYDRVYKDRPGFEKAYRSENILPLAPAEGKEYHMWYISEQSPEEVICLKLFDSEAHVEGGGKDVVECAPHSAFRLHEQEGKPLRRSVEIRVMVVW